MNKATAQTDEKRDRKTLYVIQRITYDWYRFCEVVGATTDHETAHKIAMRKSCGCHITEDVESSTSGQLSREERSHILIEAFEDPASGEHNG